MTLIFIVLLKIVFTTAHASTHPDELNVIMHSVAIEAAQGKVSPEAIEAAKNVGRILNIGCHGVGIEPNASVLAFQGTLYATMSVVEKPKADCKKVVHGYAWAKAYWSELICIAEHVVWASSFPSPNLHYIHQLSKRAETLRQWIDIVFPNTWDERNQLLIRRWKPISGTIEGYKSQKLHWGGLQWTSNIPEGFEIGVVENAIQVSQRLSTTSFCLEKQFAILEGLLSAKENAEATALEAPLVLAVPGT